MRKEVTADTALHAAVRIINEDSAKITKLESRIAELTAQRDRLIKQMAIDAHNIAAEQGHSFPNDRSAVEWNRDEDVIRNDDLPLWSDTDRTTYWPEW